MFCPRLCFACVAITTVVAEVLTQSQQPVALSEPRHETALGEQGHADTNKQSGTDLATRSQQLQEEQQLEKESSKLTQAEEPEQVKEAAPREQLQEEAPKELVHDDAKAELVNEAAPKEPVHADAKMGSEQMNKAELVYETSPKELVHADAKAGAEQMNKAEQVSEAAPEELVHTDAKAGAEQIEETAPVDPVHTDAQMKAEPKSSSTTSTQEQQQPQQQQQQQVKEKAREQILEGLARLGKLGDETIEVAADGSEVEVSTRNPHTQGSVEQPQTQTKSTTEILVQPSGAVVVENSAQAPEAPMPHKARAGTNARRIADKAAAGFHDSQSVSANVLRQEPDLSESKEDGFTTASPVLRMEATPKKFAAEIRLASVPQPAAPQPAYVSRGHRIPSTRSPKQHDATTTTTAAAVAAVEPESLGWKHGFIPGLLAHLQVEESRIIQVCIAVFLVLVVLGICACRYAAGKSEEAPEVTGRSSMFSGLSSVDFVDGEDEGVRAILKRIWASRRGPSMAAPTYPGGVETPTPTIIAQGQPSQSGVEVYLDPSLF